MFARVASTWKQQGTKLTGGGEVGNGRFGSSVALSAFGDSALIGGPTDAEGVGAAWVFARAGATWEQQGSKLTAADELGEGRFGSSVALSGDGEVALIGAPYDDAVGAVWVFAPAGATWEQQGAKLESPPEPSPHYRFGASVALSAAGATALVGGPATRRSSGAAWTYLNTSVSAPTVSSIDPASGPSEGGTQVVVRGTGFTPDATLTIGTAAGAVEVISETELKAVTPAYAAGAQEVVVSDGDGVSSGGPTYTFVTQPATLTLAGKPLAASGILASEVTDGPVPQAGLSGNVTPVTGTVFVELPGSGKFVALTGVREVPFGTIIDARRGKVTVMTVGPHGELQSMTFDAGEFELIQGPHDQVVAALDGGRFYVCPTARERGHLARASSSHASPKHVVRKLWAEGHGSYSTKGNYAAGAVVGTRWLTEDLCDGTLIRVATDSVEVTNLLTHHRLRVKAGHSYLAKAP